MTGRACKAAACCSELVALGEVVGMEILPGLVRQVDKQLTIQIDVDARDQVPGVFDADQIESLIRISEGASREIRELIMEINRLQQRTKEAIVGVVS